jgi:hypothetical protein
MVALEQNGAGVLGSDQALRVGTELGQRCPHDLDLSGRVDRDDSKRAPN